MTENIVDVINVVWPYIVSYILGHGGAIIYVKVRSKIHGFRQIIDTMDDAMTNTNITEAQAQATWQITKSLLSKA